MGAPGPGFATLGNDSRVTISDQGEIVFNAGRWIGDRSLLSVRSPWASSSRQHQFQSLNQPFFLVTREGVDGGRRGLSRHADDDLDGFVDEDPANGRDDDGDGLIDEDFAAIGDQMTVVHQGHGDTDHHLECYHWDYVHLREIMVLFWSGTGEASDNVELTLPIKSWQETTIGWSDHKSSGRDNADTTILVAEIPGDDDSWWVGVTVLDNEQSSPARLQLDGPRLVLPVDRSLTIGVAVTRTLSQLRSRMAAAQNVFFGATAAPDQPATLCLRAR